MTFHLGVPQLVFITLYLFGLFCAVSEHGKPKSGFNNAWITLLAIIINFSILIWGGFFK